MATVTRPTAGYTPSNPITNTTKYQTDSAAVAPRVAISSVKVDGDINKAFDELTNQSNRLDDLEDPVAALTDATITASDVISFADVSDSNNLKRDTVQGILDLVTPDPAVGFENGGYRSGYYYGSDALGYSAASFTVAADRLYAIPFYCHADATFDRISVVFGASGIGNARLGIYNWANGKPTTLVADLGTIAYSSATEVAATISQALTVGVYGLAVVFSATPDVNRVTTNGNFAGIFNGNVNLATGAHAGVYCSHVYGALPANFGSTTDTLAAATPWIWMRAA